MDQKDIKIKNLNSLLSEAMADNELDKLVEETSVDEVEGTKLPEGTVAITKEGNPEVTTATVLDTVDSDKDVEGFDNNDNEGLTEETSVDEVEGVKLPEGTTESEPEEGNPEVTTDTVLDTVDSYKDVEGFDNNDNEGLTEETSVDEVEGTKLPEGILEKEPEEGNPKVTTDTVLDTVDSDKDVEGFDNNDNEGLTEETSVDEVEGAKLPDGTVEKTEEGNPEVTTDAVLDTVDSDKDVEGHENKELAEAIDNLNALIESLHEETSVDEVEGVKLPEGTLEKEPEEGNPTVTTDTVLDTVDSDKDVEGFDNNDNEGLTEGCCKEEAKDVCPKCGKSPCECKKAKGYKSIKEAIALGTEYFNTEDRVNELKEGVAVLLAKENDDLLYEELVRLESEAKAVREAIEHKYSIISSNRVDSLLESMSAAEEKINAHKNDMFKKLHEQQEINTAKSGLKYLSDDEVAFKD